MVRRREMAIPLDRAITTTYKLLKVTMSLSAAFWPQFWMQCFCLQPSLTCAKLPYLNPSTNFSVYYNSIVTRLCMGLQSLWKIAIFPQPEVGHWLSDVSGTVNSLVFVLQDACCIHVRLQV